MLYQLSYIGLNQLSALSLLLATLYYLLRPILLVRVHYVFAMHPRAERKHSQHGQRGQANPLIAESIPSQNP